MSAVFAPASTSALQDPVSAPGTPFTDLDDVSDETRQAIACILDAGITRGTSATTYSPNRPVTRRQMALFLTRLLDVIEVPPPEPADPGFTDLDDVEDEARSAVARLFGHGITRGTTATTYSPNRPVTRGQMALFLARLLGVAGVGPVSGFVPGFGDTAALDAESTAAIAQMLADDVMRGWSASEFAPAEPVTRDHMAWFLSRAVAVAWAGRDAPPPSGCEDIVRTHNAAARPSAATIEISPQEPLFGDAVTVRVVLTDRAGDPVPGIEVGLRRDGSPLAGHAESGPDGTAAFTLYSTSSLVSSVALEVRLEGGLLTTAARTVTWSVPPIDLTDVTPVLDVRASDPAPTVGDRVDIVATVTDTDGNPLFGAELEFIVDGESRGTAFAGPEGRATFTYDAPTGPANEGGYDSVQVLVVSTEAASRPVGVFWQPSESRRITISVSPDRPHAGAARTITAAVFGGSAPLAGQAVHLYIDGTLSGTATTGSGGTASFRHAAAVHGPFDLAKVVLASDPSVASNEILISWPMTARGSHSSNDWELVWSDEFNGTALDASKWDAVNNCPPGYPKHLACYTDRPENVDVSDGLLHLRSLREPYTGVNKWKGSTQGEFLKRDFTAGRVESTQSFTYGRFELLGRLPQGHGTFFAYWMQPRDSPYGGRGSASSGEIDIAEGANIGRGGNPRGQIDAQLPGPGWGVHQVVHMGDPFTNPHALTNMPVNPAESFHLYAVEWDTASIRFYVDGRRVLTVPQRDWFSQPRGEELVDNPYAPFDVPFYIIINNTVGDWALETWPGHQVPDTTVFPAEFVVDYMRVYECRPPPGTSVGGPGQGCETP